MRITLPRVHHRTFTEIALHGMSVAFICIRHVFRGDESKHSSNAIFRNGSTCLRKNFGNALILFKNAKSRREVVRVCLASGRARS